jgi:hypothetical protein
LILELYTPFRGLLRISSAPILEALSQDGTLRPEALQITCCITSDTHWDWYICEGHMITVLLFGAEGIPHVSKNAATTASEAP